MVHSPIRCIDARQSGNRASRTYTSGNNVAMLLHYWAVPRSGRMMATREGIAMDQSAQADAGVSAPINFAADRSDGGIWSNLDRSLITQKLEAHDVEFRNARRLASPPSLEREGFELHHLPVGEFAWADPEWIASVYIPPHIELLRELTGAPHIAAFHGGAVLIRDSGDPAKPAAAEFVHFDQTRQSAVPFVEAAADADIRARYPRAKILNVWRVLTPPPQDMPLALCDQRTVDEGDGVVGRTVEPNFPGGVPYLTSVHNPRQQWYYFPDVTPDDVIFFKNYDSDPDAPLGCLQKSTRLNSSHYSRSRMPSSA